MEDDLQAGTDDECDEEVGGPADEAGGEAEAADVLVETDPGVFQKLSGGIVGRIHSIGSSKKATCKVHGSCVCWVQPYITPDTLEGDLKDWLREVAVTEPASRAAHVLSAYHLKRKCGMKPRKMPGAA